MTFSHMVSTIFRPMQKSDCTRYFAKFRVSSLLADVSKKFKVTFCLQNLSSTLESLPVSEVNEYMGERLQKTSVLVMN